MSGPTIAGEVRLDNRDGGTFNAHAWVEYLGRPVNDADDIALRFPAFDQDLGASQERAS